jgi:dTDP-4-amino-4,6-dideoxygalactose transaminase
LSNDLLPFNRAAFGPQELQSLRTASTGTHFSGDGPFTRACHAVLERELGVHRALLTTSCTHALEMCALLLDLQPGDEVIVPAFTFVSTINAFVLRGAVPVFADIRRDTLNLDERTLPGLVTARTRAIVAVHYAGVGCEMDEIQRIAAAARAVVVEDNAHGLFGRYRGRWLGTLGSLATQSFHETKNFTCGEGGALLINDPSHVERSEILREKGTNRSRFFRGQVDKYTWVDLGSSYLPSDLLASLLLPQLEGWRHIQARREQIWKRYDAALAEWAAASGVVRPFVPAHCEQAFHMYYLLLPSLKARSALIEHLKSRGIGSAFHYQPLNRSPMGMRLAPKAAACPVTEDVADRLLRLPFFNALSDEQQDRVIDAVLSFRP